MKNAMQKALIKKDIRSITANKRLFSVLLIVPLVITVILPSVFIIIIAFTPIESSRFAVSPHTAARANTSHRVEEYRC